jgi:hypothetical protein
MYNCLDGWDMGNLRRGLAVAGAKTDFVASHIESKHQN